MEMTGYSATRGCFIRHFKEMQIAMLIPDIITYTSQHHYEPDAAPVNCVLLGERVAERVCHQLKNELNAWWRCDLACRGCCRRWLR